MSPRAAMVLAAGLGTRMGALTRTRPKPLIEVGGRALIDHALDLVAGAAIPRAVVNLHHHAAMLEAHLAARRPPPEVVTVHEPERLETGGGLLNALPLLGPGPVAVLNSDALWLGPNPLAALAAAWDGGRMGALLALVPQARARAHAGADFALAADGRLERAADGGLIYGGAAILDPAPLPRLGRPGEAFSLNRLFDHLAARGRLHGLVWPGIWVDVGTPAGIAAAEAALREAQAG